MIVNKHGQSLNRETKTETKHKLEKEKIRIVSPPTTAWGAILAVFLNAPFRSAAWLCKWVRCWSRSIGQTGQAFCHVQGPTAVRKKQRIWLHTEERKTIHSLLWRLQDTCVTLQFPTSFSKYLPATLNYSHYVLRQCTQLPQHTVQDCSCSLQKKKTHCKSSRGALINSHETPHASVQLSLTSTVGKQTFQGLFKYNHCT